MAMEPTARGSRRRSPRLGSALVAVLWCVVVLSVVGYGILYSTQIELRIAKNQGDSIQAYYLALAGIETVKARIYEEARARRNQGENYRSKLLDDPASFRDVELGRGRFRIVRGARENETTHRLVYGVRDEEARLDINVASAQELSEIPGMTADVVASIIDWRDGDHEMTPQGAERDYYAALPRPYRIRDGPLRTLRELLSVKGVSEEMLLGEDGNLNGVLDPEENDGDRSFPPDDRDGRLDAGWSAWLTVFSGTPDVDARGRDRIDIATADETELMELDGVSSHLAGAIIAYRKKQAFKNIGQLLDVTEVREEAAPQPGNGTQPGPPDGNAAPGGDGSAMVVVGSPNPSGNGGASGSGEKLITPSHFQRIADRLTVSSEFLRRGMVNINTAAPEVLACLPGLDRDIAEAIVSHRRQIGEFTSIGQLLDVPGVEVKTFQQACPRLTVRPGTFRIRAEGFIPSTRARRRLEAVVRMTSYDFDVLNVREES